MEPTQSLIERTYNVACKAASLRILYQKNKFGGAYVSTAVTFDNLQNNTEALRIRLATAMSHNEKLKCILESFQDPCVTLRDFMHAVAAESVHEVDEIRTAVDVLVELLDNALHVMEGIKLSLGDHTEPQTMYTPKLENEMTEKVREYLIHQGTPEKSAKDLRNYVLFLAVVILGQNLIHFLQELH